jgi:uncharacterized protein (TIGR01370 family)
MNHRDRLRIGLLMGCLLSPARGPVMGQPGRHPRDADSPAEPQFVVYYGTQDHPALYSCDIGVLDSDIDAAIVRRVGRGSLLLGYLSLGEVHMSRLWAPDMERQGLLLSANPQWRDARFIDLRDRRWSARVLDELVPALLARGFGGLFLDTLDDAAYLESLDPLRFGGMSDAAVELVHALRRRYSQLPIMVNRGYHLLPRILYDVDMVLGESVHSTYDPDTGAYVHVAAADVRWQMDRLKAARRARPELQLFSLDYWSPKDPVGLTRIYAQARANGLVPYVGTIDLTQIVPRA